MNVPLTTLRVRGIPAPQGSKTGFVNPKTNRAILVEGGSKVGREKHKSWRAAVTTAARDFMASQIDRLSDEAPVYVAVTFLMPQPASRKRERWVTVKPDLDKLQRALLDGLADSGLLSRDQRVAQITACKQYAVGEDPGAVIEIGTIVDEAGA